MLRASMDSELLQVFVDGVKQADFRVERGNSHYLIRYARYFDVTHGPVSYTTGDMAFRLSVTPGAIIYALRVMKIDRQIKKGRRATHRRLTLDDFGKLTKYFSRERGPKRGRPKKRKRKASKSAKGAK